MRGFLHYSGNLANDTDGGFSVVLVVCRRIITLNQHCLMPAGRTRYPRCIWHRSGIKALGGGLLLFCVSNGCTLYRAGLQVLRRIDCAGRCRGKILRLMHVLRAVMLFYNLCYYDFNNRN